MKLSFQQWLKIVSTSVQPEHSLYYPLSAQPRYELDRAVTQTEKSKSKSKSKFQRFLYIGHEVIKLFILN